ncbi:unnamed protein product [Closterium sp. Naga37s-1]|nr:unnamed protein product [Closterium sp. Naga37s-1]
MNFTFHLTSPLLHTYRRVRIVSSPSPSSTSAGDCPVLGKGFFFGLATAPAHVEDQLDDAWLRFARRGSNEKPDRGPVRAWHNVPKPEQRLRFWTEPEVEVDLAARAGVEAFRMGVDWGRIVLREPQGGQMEIDHAAVARYKEIMALVRARGMHVMLTLFHHSLPSWAEPIGGWTNASLVGHFDSWTQLAVREFGPLVDYWVTFNEPHLFVILTYCMGVWPPGKAPSLLQSALCMSPVGQYSQAMQHIGEAHISAFKIIKKGSAAPVGVAANTAFMTPFSALDVIVPLYIDWMTLFPWVDHIQHHLDFCGLNYYGQEFMSTAGLQSVDEEEFSEAGRAVYPDGFYRILMAFHRRYSPNHPALRFIVTENGFADTEDNIRRPYLIEHLLALNAAIKEGMPIDAYFHWTITDNWEWADGYCPKFGLAGVDRASANLTRVLRPSYGLFKEIVESRQVTVQQREEEWGQLQQRAQRGEQRSYCRAVEPSGRMGADSLDSPTTRVIATKDWRYGEYRRPKAAVMVKRTARIVRIWLEDLLLAAQQAADAANSLLCRLMHGPHHQHQQQQQHQQQEQQHQHQEAAKEDTWEDVEVAIQSPRCFSRSSPSPAHFFTECCTTLRVRALPFPYSPPILRPPLLPALPASFSPLYPTGTNGPGAQWQQELQQVLPPHSLARPRRVLLLVPTEAQQQAAAKAWSRLQRQQSGQQAGQQGAQQARQQEASGAAGSVVVAVEVVGSQQWDLLVSHPAAFDLALLTAVCAPPPSPPSTLAVHSLWPPSRIQAALAAPVRALLILGDTCTLSAGSDTWRHVIGGARAQGRFLDLEQCDAAMGRAIRARRAAVDDMRHMLQHAKGEGGVAGEGRGSHGSPMHWHDLPWTPHPFPLVHPCSSSSSLTCDPLPIPPRTIWPLPCRQGLFSPEFGEALQRQQSVEVVLLLWFILQGRHSRKEGKGAACWVEGRGRQQQQQQQQQDEVSRVFDDIVHVDVVGDLCLIWSTDHRVPGTDSQRHGTSLVLLSLPIPCKQVVRLWALVPESQCQRCLHRICMHLTSYSPAYLHYCSLHQYHPSPPYLRMPAVVQQPSVLWFKPPSETSAAAMAAEAAAAGVQVDVVTPPKFIMLQPAMALSLLGEGGGAAACALSSVPFEVNAEERAAILCPSSLVVHGRSGTGKTTVIIHRALRLHRLFCHSTVPASFSTASHQLSPSGTHCGKGAADLEEGGVGSGVGVGVGGGVGGGGGGGLRQVVVTRSLQLCAAIQTEITHAARALSALDAIQPGSALPEATQQQAAPSRSAHTGHPLASSSSSSSSSGGALLMREDLERALMGGLPTCIAAIPPAAFPLALTLSKLLRLLDASVTHPFLQSTRRRRKREAASRRLVLAVAMSGQGLREAWEEGEIGHAWGGRVEKERWEAHSSGAWGRRARGAGEGRSMREGEGIMGGWQQHGMDREERAEGQEEQDEEEEEVEVDFERFKRHYWPAMDQRSTRKAVMGAAFVYREITSHIKGSLQAIRSPLGHVGEEEYVRGMVGSNQRTSAMGESERRAVYGIFQAYERKKRQRREYDSGDLVVYLHREIRRMRENNEPWWSAENEPLSACVQQPMRSTAGRTSSSYSPSHAVKRSPASSSSAAPGPTCPPVFDCVSVDEVQDLTQAQLALLPLLCGNVASGFLFAGDTAQCIAHGVDFRFEDLARVVYNEFLNREDECSRDVVVNPGHERREQGAGQRRSKVGSHCESTAPGSNSSSSSSSKSKFISRAPVRALPQYQLVRNYRTHNGILKLANSVVQLLRSFFPTAIDRLNEELSTVEGVAPVMASVSPAWKRQLAQGMPLSATQAIIVRSAEQKRALSALFPVKPVILTVEECKGLEYEDVFLLNFFRAPHSTTITTTPWSLLYTYMHDNGLGDGAHRSGGGGGGACPCETGKQLLAFDELKHCSLCADLKQLYVAITRAKQRLWVLDEADEESGPSEFGVRAGNHSGPMMDLWAAMGLVVVKHGEEIGAQSVKRASEEKDWRSLAFTFFQRGDYEAAEAAYERAGDTFNARFSRAMLLYVAGMGRTPPPTAEASSVLQSACPSALPSVHADLSLLSAADLLLAAARLFEDIGRGAEAGRTYSKARSFEDAVRVYLSVCHPPDNLKAARCYERLGRCNEAADCYSAGGDMHSALSVCLRARTFSKGLSLLDSWQSAEATSASGALPNHESLHMKGWYVTQCAVKHEEERDYNEMLRFIRLHPSLQAKREFLERGRHLRQLAVLEREEGDSTRVPLLLQRAGMLLEAALCLWQLGWPGRSLVCFVRHLQWRLNMAGRGAWMGEGRGGGEEMHARGGVELGREEVEMAQRLRGVERWGFSDRMACEDCDLGWAKVEMGVLLFLLQHYSFDGSTGGGSGVDVSSSGEAAVSAPGDDKGMRKDVEREARISQAWRMVRLGQMLHAGGVEAGGGTAGGQAGCAGGGSVASAGVSGEVSGCELLGAEMTREEMIEAGELWHEQNVRRKAAEKAERERRESQVQWQEDMVAQEEGCETEWKGAEQLRAELMLAHLGLQVAVRMLQHAQQRLVLWLEGRTESTARWHAAAAAGTAAQRLSAALPCTGTLTRVPAIAHLQHKVALWWARWSARLTPLLGSLHYLQCNAMPAADSSLPHLHAAFSLLSASFHRRLSSSCQLDDMALPWAKGVALEPLASTGRSGAMEGRRAVEVVAGVWEREYASRLNGAKQVACSGAVTCSSALLSRFRKVHFSVNSLILVFKSPFWNSTQAMMRARVFNSQGHSSAVSEVTFESTQKVTFESTQKASVSSQQPPYPSAQPLALLPLVEHSLALLHAAMHSCSRSAIVPFPSATPLHHLFTSLLLHPPPPAFASNSLQSCTHPTLSRNLRRTLLELLSALVALLHTYEPSRGALGKQTDGSGGGSRAGRGSSVPGGRSGWGMSSEGGGCGWGKERGGNAMGQSAAMLSVPLAMGDAFWRVIPARSLDETWRVVQVVLRGLLYACHSPSTQSSNNAGVGIGKGSRRASMPELLSAMPFSCSQRNPLLSVSSFDFSSTQALLHEAWRSRNDHGAAEMGLSPAWAAPLLLPLAPLLSDNALLFLPYPPASILDLPPPLADVLARLLCVLVPALHAVSERDEEHVGHTGGKGRPSEVRGCGNEL